MSYATSCAIDGSCSYSLILCVFSAGGVDANFSKADMSASSPTPTATTLYALS